MIEIKKILCLAALCSPLTAIAEEQGRTTQPGDINTTLPEVEVYGDREAQVSESSQAIDTTPYQETEQTVGTRFPAEIRRIPQSIQVINKTILEDQGSVDLYDILKNVPSATVGSSRIMVNGLFGSNQKIRGFDFSVNRNGIRHLYFEDVDPSALSNVERVEIIKGPGSAVIGQEGLGGTLNYVTKKPMKDFHAKLRGTIGEYMMRSGTWDITGPLTSDGALSGRFTGEIERSDTFVENMEINRDNVAASFAWDDGGPLRGFLSAEYQERQSQFHPGLPIFGTVLNNGVGKVDRSSFLGDSKLNGIDYDGTIVQAWLEYDINQDWKITPRFQYFEWNGLQDNLRLRAPDATNPNIINRRGRHDFHEHDYEYTGQLQLTGKFDTAVIKHQTLTGFEYTLYDDIGFWNDYINVPSIDAVNPRNPRQFYEISKNPRTTFNNTLHTWAFYFQDLIAVTDKFDILGSVRYQDLDVVSGFGGFNVDQDSAHVTYQIGGAYKILEPVSVFAGYGTGLDVDNILGSTNRTGVAFKPEESTQIEAGVKFKTESGLSGTLAYFDSTHSNVGTPDPVDPNFSIQIGEEKARGAELELAWQANDNLFLQGGYAYIDAEVSKSNDKDLIKLGNKLVNVPEHQANIFGRYLFTEGLLRGFSVGAGVNYVGQRAGNAANSAPLSNGRRVSFDLPDFVTVDLSAAYKWNNYKLELFAQNVTDEEYYSGLNDFSISPGDPRTVYARLGVEF